MNRDRILVVDDEENWHSTIARIFQGRYDLEFASDPARSLALVRDLSFSLAILDQRLGPTTGIDLLDQLRAIQPDLQAIILTGYPDIEDADKGIVKGVIGYLAKGNKQLPDVLRHRVATILDNRVSPIVALIRKGESDELEFKSSARWDMKLQRVNKDIEAIIVKTVAGFLNSYSGGDLLIGVNDEGQPVGLKYDYQTLARHQDQDGFESFLVKLLTDAFGKDVSAFIHFEFHRLGNNDICRVTAKPAAHEIYVEDEKFFLRIGNTTHRLNTREANEYCRVRWRSRSEN